MKVKYIVVLFKNNPQRNMQDCTGESVIAWIQIRF